MININSITHEATIGLIKLDKSFVGTPHYIGLEYFWAWEYRHLLRNASVSKRRRIHKAFLDKDLPLDGESTKHLSIINQILRPSGGC